MSNIAKRRLTLWNMIKAAAIVLVLFLLARVIMIYGDYMEIQEIGSNFVSGFWKDFSTNLLVKGVILLFAFVIVLVNLIVVRRNVLRMGPEFGYMKGFAPVVLGSFVVAFLVSWFLGGSVSDKLLPYVNSQWFGLGDPIFYQDVGYYIFQRPFMMAVVDSAFAILLFATVLMVGVYAITYARYNIYDFKKLLNNKNIIIHVVISIGLTLVPKALSYKFKSEDLLFSNQNGFFGAGFTDIRVWNVYYGAAPYLLLVMAALVIFCAFRTRRRWILVSAAAFPTIWFVALMFASMVQTLYVTPNKMMLEESYIANNINFTRMAYGLDEVVEHDFPLSFNLTGQDVMKNMDTVSNIRINDPVQMLKVLNRTQNLRNFYSFSSADVLPYMMNGRKTAVQLSAREINADKVTVGAKNYADSVMTYTHGIGVVMNPINAVTETGQPYLVIKDVPTRSFEGMVSVVEPRIYYGEMTQGYAIVGTKSSEYDELEPDYSYKGAAGIEMNLINRFAYAMKYTDINILVSGQIQSGSRLLTNRNVLERVAKVAPFLQVDSDPALVVDDEGKLKWVVDLYTTSEFFPYSQPSDGVNYIRNSVKAVVDAYEGSVKFYIVDKKDPLVRSWAASYPSFFEGEDFPRDLAEHMRYPEYLFRKQTAILAQYHEQDPKTFYQRSGAWAIAKEKYDSDKYRDVSPNYGIVNLDVDEKPEEFVLSVPYTVAQRENVTAWAVARCEADKYGQIVLYRFPTVDGAFGTYPMDNKIDTDPQISAELALWNSTKSGVMRGSTVMVPIENSILYIEPIYVLSDSAGEEGAIPEVKRVVVAYNDNLVMAPTLDEALRSLFGINVPSYIENENIADAIDRVVKTFELYKGFSQGGQWKEMGETLKILDEAIQELKGYNEELLREKVNQELTP